jgi:hypothetical protein
VHRVRTAGGWLHIWAPGRISWWIAILFLVGSALFSIGGYQATWSDTDAAELNRIFFSGSLFFTTAALLQLLEAINSNMTASGQTYWRWFAWMPRNLGYLASFVQLIGTILFNFNTADAMITGMGWIEEDVLVWTPNVLGCVCFLVASYLAFVEVCHWWASIRPRDLSWWIAVINLAGSLAFMASAVYAFAGPGAPDPEAMRLAGFFTFAGALCFLAGSYLLLPEMFENKEPQ